MRKVTTFLVIGVSSVVLMLGAACSSPQARAALGMSAEEKGEEKVVKLSEAPAAVQAAVAKVTSSESVKKVTKETDDDEDVVTFEVDYVSGGTACSITLSSTGDILEMEKGVEISALPAAAASALKEEYKKAALGSATMVHKTYYEIEITVDGKKREIKIDAAGNIEDEDKGDKWKKGEKENDEKGEKDTKEKKEDKKKED